MLESDGNGNEALLSAANSFSRNVNDTDRACYDISYLAHGLKGIIQFWIKTADKVWQTRLTEELKISQFLSREMRQIGAENDNCFQQ